MVRFLSTEWFERVEAAQGDPPAAARGENRLVLAQAVTDGPEGTVGYQVVVEDGRASVSRGAPDDADVTFTTNYATAAAIARGELSTQAALSAGRIRVAGNLGLLVSRHGAITALATVPGTVRRETTY